MNYGMKSLIRKDKKILMRDGQRKIFKIIMAIKTMQKYLPVPQAGTLRVN